MPTCPLHKVIRIIFLDKRFSIVSLPCRSVLQYDNQTRRIGNRKKERLAENIISSTCSKLSKGIILSDKRFFYRR